MEWEERRAQMVEWDLIPRGIQDPSVLGAMGTVKRHLFVPEDIRNLAYEDGPLAIGEGQTISQPYIVALMAQAAQIRSESTVLEIGTGSGYGAAVLASIAQKVVTVERLPSLAQQAEGALQKAGIRNVEVVVSDGTLGYAEEAPYDAIVVTAAAPEIPLPLLEQLKVGGRLIVPVGERYSQDLLRVIKREEGEPRVEFVEAVRFVPLIGKAGWKE